MSAKIKDLVAAVITDIATALDFYGAADSIDTIDVGVPVKDQVYRQVRDDLSTEAISAFLDYVSDNEFKSAITPKMRNEINFVKNYQRRIVA